LQEQLEAVQPMISRAEELLRDSEQLTPADTADTVDTADTAVTAAETCRYDALLQRYHDTVSDVAGLVSETAESIQKRENLNVSCWVTSLSY